MNPREELLKIQKTLFRRNQRLIRESIFAHEPDLARYEKTYKRHLRGYMAVSTVDEMIRACRQADLIYVGDYHTLNQSQRSFLRILKAMIRKNKPEKLLIGLELIHARHQKVIDAFLAGKISERTFLKKVGFKARWIYDLWNNFKPIFDFARYHGVPLFGIDAAPNGAGLTRRDKASAAVIAKIVKKHPERKLFIFIGDLHIVPAHLPRETARGLKKEGLGRRRELFLFQNSAAIYWKLAEEGLEQLTEVVRINARSFCRMHTPPVIMQRSYLNWLEHEEGEIDYADAKHSFIDIVHRITQFLKIDVGQEADEAEVYTSGDLSFLEKIRKSGKFSPQEIATIKGQIIHSESYYIPKLRIVYLSNISLNHAGEEAAHFVKHICSGEEKPRDPFDAFYANVLHEALAFFGSKIINHKRKCYHENEFRRMVQYFRTMAKPFERQLEYETALLTFQAKLLEKRGEAISDMEIFTARPDLFFSVAHALGYILGDKLYYALLEGAVSKPEIRHLFYDPWKNEGKPFEVYWTLLEKTKEVKIPKRM